MNQNSIRRIFLYNPNAIEQSHSRFPNVNELILMESFVIPHYWLMDDFDRVIPLSRLTQIIIQCHDFPFDQLLEFLSFTPNLRNLELHSVLFERIDSVLINQQSVTHINRLTNLIIRRRISLEEIQLLTTLFSRLCALLQSIYMKMVWNQFYDFSSQDQTTILVVYLLCVFSKTNCFKITCLVLANQFFMCHGETAIEN